MAQSNPNSPAPAGAGTPRKGPLAVALALLTGGVGVSAYLVHAKVSLENDPNFKSACNFGDKLNCDVVQTSKYATAFGLPLSLLAIPVYLLMMWFAVVALRSEATLERPRAVETSRNAAILLGSVGLLTVLFSLYLAFISSVVLEVFCLFCISMYVVNIGSTAAAIFALGEGFGGFFGKIVETALGFKQPALSGLGVGVLAMAAALGWKSSLESGMQQSYKAEINKVFEEEEFEEEEAEPVAVPPATAGAGSAAGAPAAQGSAQAQNAAASQAGAQAASAKADAAPSMMRAKRRPKAKKTENGMSYFEVPIRDDDWAKGPADAPVTIVKFADFECGYCRVVHYNMKPLVQKYEGKVRWVMKHYPMSAECNPRMGGERMHPNACYAAFASHCAGHQGKFWEIHDLLYDNQQKMDEASVRGYAEKLGLDMAAFDTCTKDPNTRAKIMDDLKVAGQAYIYGTPRAYVNGRLVSGSASTNILEYYIQKSLDEAAGTDTSDQPTAEAAGQAMAEPTTPMLKARTSKGEFWIDAYEASITKDGRAVSIAGVMPAQASWYQAKEACEKAGKRMCTEEEWVSACAGEPAVDNNNNGFFADDDVEGRMYPYGLFYEQGVCRDAEDQYKGEPGKTGVLKACRTPEGIFDLAGNLGEWVESEENRAVVLGGDWRGGERASCDRRSTTFGAGQRNNTLGFRCCADTMVDNKGATAADVVSAVAADVGAQLPDFKLDLVGGGTFDSRQAQGKVTYLTFYASWCGSCKRELPELNDWVEAYKDQGFQVVAVGVDKVAQQSEDFAKQFSPVYPIALDPMSKTMGMFDINAMPTSYIVDRQGVIRYKEVGFKKEEVHLVKTRVETLLKSK